MAEEPVSEAETPAEEAAPVIEEAPAVEETPFATEEAQTETPSVIEETPAEEETPVDTPVFSNPLFAIAGGEEPILQNEESKASESGGWFFGNQIAEEPSEQESRPAFSFFGGLNEEPEKTETDSLFGFGANESDASPYQSDYQSNPLESAADYENPNEEADNTSLYGYEQVRTEREIIEDFVMPTFRGSGFDAPEETEEAFDEGFYKPGYKLKNFAKKDTSWLDDEEDDFGKPVAPITEELKSVDPELPMDAEPELPMDTEPELPMDAEPELPMDTEPELPMDAEPELPMDVEPELPMDVEPAEPAEAVAEASAETSSELAAEAPAETPAEEAPAEEKPAEAPAEAKEEKKEDPDRLTRLQQKLAEIRKRTEEKYGGDIFIGDDEM